MRVEQRRGDLLYLNDGTYGGLFDAGPLLNTRFPVRVAGRKEKDSTRETVPFAPFRFAGPTCDSLDMMDGPFMLPSDIREGEWIEISSTGAYSAVMRSNFNEFGKADKVILDETVLSCRV